MLEYLQISEEVNLLLCSSNTRLFLDVFQNKRLSIKQMLIAVNQLYIRSFQGLSFTNALLHA